MQLAAKAWDKIYKKLYFQLLREKFRRKMNFLSSTESLMAAVMDEEIFQRLCDIKLGLQVPLNKKNCMNQS